MDISAYVRKTAVMGILKVIESVDDDDSADDDHSGDDDDSDDGDEE